MLHRLVRRAVLAQADAIVGKDIDDRPAHHGRQTNGRAHIVGKDQEGAAVGAHAAVGRQPVEDGSHAVLSHAKVEVGAAKVASLHGLGTRRAGFVAAGQVSRAAQQHGQMRRDGVQYLAGGNAGGEGFAGKSRQCRFPVGGQFAVHHYIPLGCQVGILFAVAGKERLPLCLAGRAVFLHLLCAGTNVRRHVEAWFKRPAQRLFGAAQALLAQGLAVDPGRVLAWAAVADVGAAGDERRTFHLGLCGPDRCIHGGHVVAVHLLRVPAVGSKAADHVVAVSQPGGAVNRDVVVVVEDDEPAQPQVTGQGRYLVRHALHQIAIRSQDVGKVIYYGKTWRVKARRQPAFGQGHAHGVAQALPQRTGRRLDPASRVVLWVAGGMAAPLAETLQFVQRHGVAVDVKQSIQQGRAVTGRQDKAVTVGPGRVGRVVLEETSPQHGDQIGCAQRQAGMARVSLLHGIGGQHAQRIGQQAIGFVVLSLAHLAPHSPFILVSAARTSSRRPALLSFSFLWAMKRAYSAT